MASLEEMINIAKCGNYGIDDGGGVGAIASTKFAQSTAPEVRIESNSLCKFAHYLLSYPSIT